MILPTVNKVEIEIEKKIKGRRNYIKGRQSYDE